MDTSQLYGSMARHGAIKNRKMIDDRPKIVDEKSRRGDWEIDTIIGKNQKQAILSIVERVSKFTILKKLKQKTSEATKEALTDALTEHKIMFILSLRTMDVNLQSMKK